MEFANINDTMRTAKDQDKRFIPLFGSETFRSWMLYFRPGEHTDMHFHMSPETFLVLEGKASVKGLKGDERIIELLLEHLRPPEERCGLRVVRHQRQRLEQFLLGSGVLTAGDQIPSALDMRRCVQARYRRHGAPR